MYAQVFSFLWSDFKWYHILGFAYVNFNTQTCNWFLCIDLLSYNLSEFTYYYNFLLLPYNFPQRQPCCQAWWHNLVILALGSWGRWISTDSRPAKLHRKTLSQTTKTGKISVPFPNRNGKPCAFLSPLLALLQELGHSNILKRR